MPIIGLSLITVYMEKSIPSSTLQISKFFNTSIMPFLSSLSSRPNISYSTNSFLFTWLCSLSAPFSVFSLLLAKSHSSTNRQLLLEIVQSYPFLPLSSYSPHPCSYQHESQKPKGRSNPSVPLADEWLNEIRSVHNSGVLFSLKKE